MDDSESDDLAIHSQGYIMLEHKVSPILAALYILSMSKAPLSPYNNVLDMVGTRVDDVTRIFTQLFL